MSNGSLAGVRLAVLVSSMLLITGPIQSQMLNHGNPGGNPYDASRPFGYFIGDPNGIMSSPMPDFPSAPQNTAPESVSVHLLRNPLSSKARRALERAMQHAAKGDHAAAISRLHEVLTKYPASAPYAQSLLGLEFIETRRFAEAVNSFKEAALTIPHEASAHSNLGLSLALTGQLERAEGELHKALELDHTHANAKRILEVVLVARRMGASQATPRSTP